MKNIYLKKIKSVIVLKNFNFTDEKTDTYYHYYSLILSNTVIYQKYFRFFKIIKMIHFIIFFEIY
jgi:hypothetical protein